MYTGWVLKFRHGTHESPHERDAQLVQGNRYATSDNLASLIRLVASNLKCNTLCSKVFTCIPPPDTNSSNPKTA